jgi:hypothetical protein
VNANGDPPGRGRLALHQKTAAASARSRQKVGLPPIWFGPRLAHGVRVGGEFDYLDEGTLSAAIKQRTLF